MVYWNKKYYELLKSITDKYGLELVGGSEEDYCVDIYFHCLKIGSIRWFSSDDNEVYFGYVYKKIIFTNNEYFEINNCDEIQEGIDLSKSEVYKKNFDRYNTDLELEHFILEIDSIIQNLYSAKKQDNIIKRLKNMEKDFD